MQVRAHVAPESKTNCNSSLGAKNLLPINLTIWMPTKVPGQAADNLKDRRGTSATGAAEAPGKHGLLLRRVPMIEGGDIILEAAGHS